MSRPWNYSSIQTFIQLQEVTFFVCHKNISKISRVSFFVLEAREEHSVLWDTRMQSQTNGVASLSVCLPVCLPPPHSGPAVWYLTAQWSLCPHLPSRPRLPPQPPSCPMTSSLLHQISASPLPLPRCATGKSTFLKSSIFPFYSGFCNAKELFIS